ncbi:MAG: TIGR03943 family protein [Velocimicrobium sp.]
MGKKKNTEAIIQFIILIVSACLLLYAMLSKKVNYYVHPRFYIGLWISIIILILFAISLVSKLEKARHNVNVKHYIIFIIPLLAALLFPPTGVNGKTMTIEEGKAKNYNASENYKQTDDSASISQENEENIAVEESNKDKVESENIESENAEPENAEPENDESEKYNPYEVDGVMVINDDIFASWYDDVYDHLDDFVGKKCQYLAQVYSMEDFKENQFLAGRYFMVCCAADLVGYGIICESDKRNELKEEEWITVTGTITDYQYNGYAVPMLTDVTITKAEAPDVEYIYYNNY